MSVLSKWNTAFKNTIHRFKRDEGGQFAVLFAVSATTLIFAGGLALDGARLYSAQSKLNNAIDAAVLATTQDLTRGNISEKDARDAVGRFLFANMDPSNTNAMPAIIDNVIMNKADRTLRVDAHLILPMTLTGVLGYNQMKVASSSTGKYSNDKIEIAMALDVTGSMRGHRIADLKTAATSAIDTLLKGPLKDNVRIGLVPYAGSVNAKPVLRSISISGQSRGCVLERSGSRAFSDDFATARNPIRGQNVRPGTNSCPSNKIVSLDNNSSKLKREIRNLRTGGITAGHLGIAWAQYMLSPKWNRAWPAKSTPANYDDAKKYAIFMTDGSFNTFGGSFGGGSNSHQGRASINYAKNVCDNMKRNGVKIFTIIFSNTEPSAVGIMKECASKGSEQFFFDARNGNELKGAFDSIAKIIGKLRLVS